MNEILLTGHKELTLFTDELGYVSWTVSLEPTEAGGPYDITATLVEDSTSITLTNVMFGDVYFCSGQSNMVWPVASVSDSMECNLFLLGLSKQKMVLR